MVPFKKDKPLGRVDSGCRDSRTLFHDRDVGVVLWPCTEEGVSSLYSVQVFVTYVATTMNYGTVQWQDENCIGREYVQHLGMVCGRYLC